MKHYLLSLTPSTLSDADPGAVVVNVVMAVPSEEEEEVVEIVEIIKTSHPLHGGLQPDTLIFQIKSLTFASTTILTGVAPFIVLTR